MVRWRQEGFYGQECHPHDLPHKGSNTKPGSLGAFQDYGKGSYSIQMLQGKNPGSSQERTISTLSQNHEQNPVNHHQLHRKFGGHGWKQTWKWMQNKAWTWMRKLERGWELIKTSKWKVKKNENGWQRNKKCFSDNYKGVVTKNRTLWLFNSSRWKPWPIEIDGLPDWKNCDFPWQTGTNNQMLFGNMGTSKK
jgi:hypothetical protein